MSTAVETRIDSLEGIFSRHGAPLTIKSDNGPQFRSGQFKEYCDCPDSTGSGHANTFPCSTTVPATSRRSSTHNAHHPTTTENSPKTTPQVQRLCNAYTTTKIKTLKNGMHDDGKKHLSRIFNSVHFRFNLLSEKGRGCIWRRLHVR